MHIPISFYSWKKKKRFWNCNAMSLSRFLIYVRFVGKEKGTTPNVLSFTNINRFWCWEAAGQTQKIINHCVSRNWGATVQNVTQKLTVSVLDSRPNRMARAWTVWKSTSQNSTDTGKWPSCPERMSLNTNLTLAFFFFFLMRLHFGNLYWCLASFESCLNKGSI